MRRERLQSARMELIAATASLVRLDLDDRCAFAEQLGAIVPESWPCRTADLTVPEHVVRRRKVADHLASDEVQQLFLWYWLACDLDQGKTLVGFGQFEGNPDKGWLSISYAVVEEHRRRGYATEAVRTMLEHAEENPNLHTVAGETFPTAWASIGVLTKNGFKPAPAQPMPDAIRWTRVIRPRPAPIDYYVDKRRTPS